MQVLRDVRRMLDASPCSMLQEAAQQIPLPASMAPGLFAACFLWMQQVGFALRQGSLCGAVLMPLTSIGAGCGCGLWPKRLQHQGVTRAC